MPSWQGSEPVHRGAGAAIYAQVMAPGPPRRGFLSPASALDIRAPGVGCRQWPQAPGPTGGALPCPHTPWSHGPFISELFYLWPRLQHHSPRGLGRGPGRTASAGRLWLRPPLPQQTLGWPLAPRDLCGLCPPGCRSRAPGAGVQAEPWLQVSHPGPAGEEAENRQAVQPLATVQGCLTEAPALPVRVTGGDTGRCERDDVAGGACGRSASLPATGRGRQLMLTHLADKRLLAVRKGLAPPSGTTGASFPTAAAHCRALPSPQ